MKNKFTTFLSFMLMASTLFFMTSCGDDDGVVIDPGSGDVNVADGLYLAVSGSNPSSSALLSAETVEDESFASQDRSGFVGGYMFLEAGDYNVVQVTSKEITSTIGGTAATVTDAGSAAPCELNDYTVVTTSEGGAAFNIAASGFYRVTHDQTTKELVIYKIEKVGIIGNATEGGWSTDTDLPGTIDAAGGVWSASDVVLRSGQFKLRFNCRWSIDRRIDSNAGFDPANGYQLFTNFGGAVADLATGNDQPNIEQTEDGTYNVTFSWLPQSGVTLTTVRTGDAPVITFNPNDYQFGIIGDATVNAWNADRNLFHKENSGVHSWYGVVTFAATGEWKFRTNDAWDFDLGGDLAALVTGGGNLATPGMGSYYIVLTTADEGTTWSATVTAGGWGLIGTGNPSGSWDADTALSPDLFDTANGITTYTHTGAFTTDEWKFRAGGAWDLNIGGDLGFLTLDGGNISLGSAGTYKITLSFDGDEYSATAEPQ